MTSRPLSALLVSAALLAMTCSTSVLSAEEPAVDAGMQELATRLQLTQVQQQTIAPALRKRNERLERLRGGDEDATPPQRLKSLREARGIQQEFVGEVTPVLTQEQRAEWDRMRQEMADKLRERRASRQ